MRHDRINDQCRPEQNNNKINSKCVVNELREWNWNKIEMKQKKKSKKKKQSRNRFLVDNFGSYENGAVTRRQWFRWFVNFTMIERDIIEQWAHRWASSYHLVDYQKLDFLLNGKFAKLKITATITHRQCYSLIIIDLWFSQAKLHN